MRNAFVETITELAKTDERIVILSSDIGNNLWEEFKSIAPNRFYNVGISEQNMIGVASGLAMKKLRPFCYTICSFTTSRNLEQIKLDLCYHNVPAVIVGIGAGLCYISNSTSHQSLEDIAILRTYPNLTILAPSDPVEVRAMIPEILSQEKPLYFRLGKAGEKTVHKSIPNFKIGEYMPLIKRAGSNVCILSVGNMLPSSMEVSEKLLKHGIASDVFSVGTVVPLNVDFFTSNLHYDMFVTIEEHSQHGGYGSLCAELFVSLSLPNKLLICGATSKFLKVSADQNHARKLFGLDVDSLLNNILENVTLMKMRKNVTNMYVMR